jgi:DNA-binding IclR family transcriptional regulator
MQRAATVDKSLDILEAISASRGNGLGIRELARRLDINSTTVHNLVWTLCARGYLAQAEASRRFVLGPACLSLAQGDSPWQDLARRAGDLVRQCQAELDESIMLAARQGTEIFPVVYVPCAQALRVDEPEVMAERAYSTAVGKLLLSTLTEPELAAYLRAYPSKPFTPRTVTAPAAIRQMLAAIRSQGYAEARDELMDGISAVAVGVETEPGSKCVTALGASAPTIRMDAAQARKTLATLRRYADLIRGV